MDPYYPLAAAIIILYIVMATFIGFMIGSYYSHALDLYIAIPNYHYDVWLS